MSGVVVFAAVFLVGGVSGWAWAHREDLADELGSSGRRAFWEEPDRHLRPWARTVRRWLGGRRERA